MVAITTLAGEQVDVPDTNILLIVGPYPNDVGPHTYVYGPGVGALITSEAPQLLLSRLETKADFAVLARPNGTPAWVHAPDVTRGQSAALDRGAILGAKDCQCRGGYRPVSSSRSGERASGDSNPQ